MTELRTCSHCGYQGKDVLSYPAHVGGVGDVLQVHCADLSACMERQREKGYRYTRTPAILGDKKLRLPCMRLEE